MIDNNSTNIFRENSEVIKEHFIVSFVGEPNIKKYYVKSTLEQEWIKSFKNNKEKVISKSDYEKRLISYFETPKIKSSNHHLILLVGGVGSGKSSSIRYAMHKAKMCQDCELADECQKNYPDRIVIDFLKFKKNANHESEEPEEYKVTDEVYHFFWQHLINILDTSINNAMSIEKEVKEFWPWLIGYKNKHYSFYNFLDTHKEEILNQNTSIERLGELRIELRNKFSRKHLAYYKLFHISFLRKNRSVKCNILLFDNIDTLPPILQTELVKFSEEAFVHLSSKSILLVRPLTYLRNVDASNFMEKIDHSKANLHDVFLRRLNRLKNDDIFKEDSRVIKSKSLISCLEKAINLFPASRVYSDIFVSTSGRSIRYGLKNFYNFLLSPYLTTHENGIELNKLQVDNNSFFQSYFCGENNPQWIDENNFVNLFSISLSKKTHYLSNIKLRILDLMNRTHMIQVNELFEILEAFGYKAIFIHNAINDLLKNRKALIWSSHVTNYDLEELKRIDHHTIRLTDLGYRYYSKLLIYLNYIRECLIPIDGKRIYGNSLNLQNIYQYIQELENMDMKQIETFIIKRGLVNYNLLYPILGDSLSLSFWKKISPQINTLNIRYPEVVIDNKKENNIIKKTKEIIKSAENKR